MTTVYPIPDNHAQRFALHNEVHARSSLILGLPLRATHLALSRTGDEKLYERHHLAQLCERFGNTPPAADADHFSATFDTFQLRWEQHGEFSTYTFYVQGTEEKPFASPALKKVPIDWLSAMTGKVLVATHATILPVTDSTNTTTDLSAVSPYFASHPIIGSTVTGGAANVFTDFRIHVDGFSRFLIVDHNLRVEQGARLLHRLFEIEVYRVLALLAFPIARQLSPELKKADQQLYTITNAMTQSGGDDTKLLEELTALAAEIENHISSNHLRFAAAEAYYTLVERRLVDLREVRIQGIQTIGEFINRRLEPAVNTCRFTSNRFKSLSERVGNASQLLRTRVDIMIERQNQRLLTSMNLRAKMQLRMQQMVEGISIVAITYYAASLIRAMTQTLQSLGVHVEPEVIEGASIPFILIAIGLGLRRIHHIIKTTTDAS
ncbi:MAG TPA: DUF3422 domain-containing protein [Methylococcaceae bacterium]|nr:DUF3422 domain-containing protein [Methylococcaceae bacterium]